MNGENGDIEIGDPIATSHAPGLGMKATEFGLTIGIAQESITFASPEETKLVAVQYGLMYANADKINTQASDSSTQNTSATTQDTPVLASVISAFQNAYDIIFDKGLVKVAQIITDKFTTKELCIEEVCIGKPQLQTLLNNAGVVSSLPPIQAQTPTSTVEIVPTEEASSTTATSTSE